MMRALLFGAVLGVLLVTIGLPLTVPSTVVTTALAHPLVVAFAAGLAARTHLARSRGWTR